MKAVGYCAAGAIDREDALVDIELETPRASGRNLLVEVKAVSVNPVDTKVRQGMAPAKGTKLASRRIASNLQKYYIS